MDNAFWSAFQNFNQLSRQRDVDQLRREEMLLERQSAQAQQARQQRQDDWALEDRTRATGDRTRTGLASAFEGALRLPLDQRESARAALVEGLRMQGADEAALERARTAPMDDASLRSGIVALGGELDAVAETEVGDYIRRRDPYSGATSWDASPGAATNEAYRQAQTRAAEALVPARQASAAASTARAAATTTNAAVAQQRETRQAAGAGRTRGGRGRGGRGGGSAPAAAPASRPWERRW